MQQNKIRKESSISSQVKWVLLSIFTDHKRFKEQISHATWGDQRELTIMKWAKVLKVSGGAG